MHQLLLKKWKLRINTSEAQYKFQIGNRIRINCKNRLNDLIYFRGKY
jgi:hypothetical protein